VSQFMRVFSWLLLALAILTATGDASQGTVERVAWSLAFVAAAAVGFRLSSRVAVRLPKPSLHTSARRRSVAAISVTRFDRDPRELIVRCERRIGRTVDIASYARVKTPSGARNHVLAVAAGYVWWLELHPWRDSVGRIVHYRPLDGLAAHSEPRRRGRHLLELSWPANGELFVATLHGPGADGLAGQLAAEQFARAGAGTPGHKEGR
jgi:hypothetical protein